MNQRASILNADDVPASVLLAFVVDGLGLAALSYEVEVLVDWLRTTHGVDLSDRNTDKLHGLLTIYLTNAFYTDLTTFRYVCDALAGEGVTDQSDMPHVEDLAWAVVEARMNDPVTAAKTEFNIETKLFVRAVLSLEGFSDSPFGLEFVGKIPENSIDANVGGELTDPSVLAALAEIQDEKLGAVQSYVAERALRVLSDINAMQLKHIDSDSWAKYATDLQ